MCRWLVLDVVNNFLASFMITFAALHLSEAHLSQQMANAEKLAET